MTTPLTLTGQIRAATREIHNVSDNLVNLKLVVALTDKQLYGRALMLFYYIHVQLEASIRKHQDHDAFRGLYEILNEIARADGIAKDLRFYLGEDWSTKYQSTQAVQNYVNHLQELEKKNPILVLPYCYHMYMAMLAGGAMIKKLALRDTIKEKIDTVPHDEETKKKILAESMTCFKMNNQERGNDDGNIFDFF
ncbi:hypothetical protein PInf_014878 [Phytophthora infestans]|nr:hypothetical protein PInf_014878 [Phytophthora infestans]